MDEKLRDKSEDSKPLNPDQQFALLQIATEEYGVLHEAQVHQLNVWFMGAVGNDFFKDYKIGWSHETKEVEYRLIKPNMHKAPNNLSKRMEVLHESIKWLLGEQYRLRVVENSNNRVIYDSSPSRGKQKRRKKTNDEGEQ